MRPAGRLLLLASALATVMFGQSTPAAADLCPVPPPSGCVGRQCVVRFVRCEPPPPPDVPPGRPGLPTDTHPPLVRLVPTCPGNTPENGSGLCNAAVLTCPEPVSTRYWRYERLWIPQDNDYGPWTRQPGFVCLSPEQAAAAGDGLAAVIAAVRADWKTFDLPPSIITTRPTDQTLVGAMTLLSTSSPRELSLPPRSVLGQPVNLRLKAVQYVWTFGDNALVDERADETSARVGHVYRAAGVVAPSLRTLYSATFTIGADSTVYALDGLADVPGPPAVLIVREARSQLEAGHPVSQ